GGPKPFPAKGALPGGALSPAGALPSTDLPPKPALPPAPRPPKPNPPNIIRTGTFSLASLGVPTVIAIVTSIDGQSELSTRPCSCFSTTVFPATVVSRVSATVQVTLGTFGGIRPMTSRSKSSTISGRRCFHHASAVFTRWPFFSASGSGRLG